MVSTSTNLPRRLTLEYWIRLGIFTIVVLILAALFDLRNSGESDGGLTSLGLLEANDVKAAIQFVEEQLEPQPRLALVGHSMGAAASLLAGERAGADAIVSISSFTSIEDNVASAFENMTGLPPFPFAPLVIYFAEREVGRDITEVSPL